MSSFIKKNINKILTIFLLIQPILDLLTGVCLHTLKINLTVGIIVRVLFLLFIILTVIFIFKKKKIIIPYLIIGLYFILYILGIIIYKDSVGLFYEIQNLIKVFYFPIVLIALYSIKEEIEIKNNTLFIVFITYVLLLFIPTIFGLGYKTYEITKEGTLGFFNSANEISGILSILTPIVALKILKNENRILASILSIVYLIVILMIGTKTPLLSLIFTLVMGLIVYLIGDIKAKRYKKSIYMIITLILAVIPLLIALPKTNFYKNIKTHLEFLEVENITDVFKDEKLIDHFIFSQRLTFLNKENKLYKESSLYQKIVGRAYLNNGEETKMIEMDYFDIFYHHGILGFLIFFSIVIYIVVKCFKNNGKLYDDYMLRVSFILIVLLSFFTGHILTAPAVSIIVTAIILKLSYQTDEV